MTETTLAVDGVTKRYGDFTAVAGVSFDLRRGEFLTMLGPSGSGKTTTLRMIAGFIVPDEGEIRLRGADISRTPPHKRNIGMVFQNYALFPHMTATKNVAFPLENRGVGKAEARRRACAALELVGLHEHFERRPSELSGGQQQRVALARAIVFEPDLLLMDEPLGALDRKLRASMQIELMRIARETEATVISVTHDQEEALVMSDRIAIYSHGRIEQLGTAPDLYERPASVFVADFIGDSNILRGRAAADGTVGGAAWRAVVPTHSHATGAAVALVVRPENVSVTADGGDELGPNRLRGVVSETVYLGAEWKHVVQLADGGTVEARTRRTASLPPAPGETVTVSWDPEAGVLLPDDGTGAGGGAGGSEASASTTAAAA